MAAARFMVTTLPTRGRIELLDLGFRIRVSLWRVTVTHSRLPIYIWKTSALSINPLSTDFPHSGASMAVPAVHDHLTHCCHLFLPEN